jgi:hypothetical protein
MKTLSFRPKTLSLVSNDSSGSETAEMKTNGSLRESFDGWLNSVAPVLMRAPASREKRVVGHRWLRSLSPTDLTRLNRATIREGTVHRAWPPDVVTTFLAADVIKNNRATRDLYEDRES